VGIIGKIVNYFIEDEVRQIVSELYQNYTRVSTLVCPPGLDSAPCNEDQAVGIYLDKSRKTFTVGILPPSEANPGEAIIYGRTEEGEVNSTIYLKNDGAVEITSDTEGKASYLKLNADGSIETYSGNGASTEKTVLGETLKAILEAILDAIVAMTVTTGVGPSGPPINAATFTAIKGQLTTILSAGVKNN